MGHQPGHPALNLLPHTAAHQNIPSTLNTQHPKATRCTHGKGGAGRSLWDAAWMLYTKRTSSLWEAQGCGGSWSGLTDPACLLSVVLRPVSYLQLVHQLLLDGILGCGVGRHAEPLCGLAQALLLLLAVRVGCSSLRRTGNSSHLTETTGSSRALA